jgi:hypothetical protein
MIQSIQKELAKLIFSSLSSINNFTVSKSIFFEIISQNCFWDFLCPSSKEKIKLSKYFDKVLDNSIHNSL